MKFWKKMQKMKLPGRRMKPRTLKISSKGKTENKRSIFKKGKER